MGSKGVKGKEIPDLMSLHGRLVFIYPPALWLYRYFIFSQGVHQLLQGSGEDPKIRATVKPPSLTKEQPQGCIRGKESKVRPVLLDLKIERKIKS